MTRPRRRIGSCSSDAGFCVAGSRDSGRRRSILRRSIECRHSECHAGPLCHPCFTDLPVFAGRGAAAWGMVGEYRLDWHGGNPVLAAKNLSVVSGVSVAGSRRRPNDRSDESDEGGASSDKRRPPYGLSMPCRVMGCFAADHLLVHLPGSVEFELVLVDCCAPPLHVPSEDPGVAAKLNMDGMAARDAAYMLCEQHHRTTSIWIPQPATDRGWSREIKPGSKQAGYLYLDDSTTLNERLVDVSACHRPRRPLRYAA